MNGYLPVAALFVALCIVVVSSIPVSVMLPLNTFSHDSSLSTPQELRERLAKLRKGGVDGVMVDAWWGIMEPMPKVYNWSGIVQLATMCRELNLTLQIVTSFRACRFISFIYDARLPVLADKCGTNVGDSFDVTLPKWVLEVGETNRDIYYRDKHGNYDDEYLSLGVDNQPLFNGRTPLQIYADFIESLVNATRPFMPHTINEFQIGLGPAGELRYPSYQTDRWSYCGIGEFQCYDKYMLAELASAANHDGHPEWGHGGPNNAGEYNHRPWDTDFFKEGAFDNYASDYGKFFLWWYSRMLLKHGKDILSIARKKIPSEVSIAAKIAGIHWWYNTYSHAAEVTSGYYNTNSYNAYLDIAEMFRETDTVFDFTCLEMKNDDYCNSAPENLVRQAREAAIKAGVKFSGENALEICKSKCDSAKFDQIFRQATGYGAPIDRFTYLRLTEDLLNDDNWPIFVAFVNRMANAN